VALAAMAIRLPLLRSSWFEMAHAAPWNDPDSSYRGLSPQQITPDQYKKGSRGQQAPARPYSTMLQKSERKKKVTSQLPPVAGWYADPSGAPGQKYWDGTQWQGVGVSPIAVPPDQLGQQIRQAMAENRSTWATNAMALYSLIIGIAACLLLLLCGVGGVLAIPGGIVGFLALNKSKTVNGAGKNMAIWGLVLNGAAFVIGAIVGIVILGGMASMGSSGS
jgi:hypothetical protein